MLNCVQLGGSIWYCFTKIWKFKSINNIMYPNLVAPLKALLEPCGYGTRLFQSFLVSGNQLLCDSFQILFTCGWQWVTTERSFLARTANQWMIFAILFLLYPLLPLYKICMLWDIFFLCLLSPSLWGHTIDLYFVVLSWTLTPWPLLGFSASDENVNVSVITKWRVVLPSI